MEQEIYLFLTKQKVKPTRPICRERRTGICGREASWEYDGNGTLTVFGQSDMENYSAYKPAPWHSLKESIRKVQVQQGITRLGNFAFHEERSAETGFAVQEVSLPQSLSCIGEYAFSNCRALKQIKLPLGLHTIGAGAFSGCDRLQTLLLPDSLQIIENLGFSGCSNLSQVQFPKTLVYIGDHAYRGCDQLKKAVVDSSCAISPNAFDPGTQVSYTGVRVCSGFCGKRYSNDVTWTWSDTSYTGVRTCSGSSGKRYSNDVTWAWSDTGILTISGEGEMENYGEANLPPWEHLKYSITQVQIREGVTAIGSWAFSMNRWNSHTGKLMQTASCLEKVILPESLRQIGESAFDYCRKLESVQLPKQLHTIGKRTFYCCDSLKELNLPQGLKHIESEAFYGSDVSKLTWPLSMKLENLSENAFEGSRLNKVQSFALKKTVIKEKPVSPREPVDPKKKTARLVLGFLALSVLVFLIVPKPDTKAPSAPTVQSASKDKKLSENIDWRVENGTLIISGQGPMEDYPLDWDAPWDETDTELTAVEIQNGITRIGNRALNGIWNLKAVTMADSVTEIGENAFSNRHYLEKVTLSASLDKIENNAFYGCEKLKEIDIPESVTLIGNGAFFGTGLTSVKLSETVSICYDSFSPWVTFESNQNYSTEGTLGESVQWNLDENGKLSLSGTGDAWLVDGAAAPWIWQRDKILSVSVGQGITDLYGGLFYGCTQLTNVQLSNTGSMIDYNTFTGCYSLESITLPWTVTEIGHNVFQGCTSLKTVNLPSGLTEIGYYAFWGCSSLKTIALPGKLTTINGGAFNNCSALTSISIPAGVTELGYDVFEDCTSLESIVFPAQLEVIDCDDLRECASLKSITVSRSSVLKDENKLPEGVKINYF